MADTAILLSTYNGAKYLRDQFESLINQSTKNWKLIIRDDGSTDETPQIILEYTKIDSRFVFLDTDNDHLGPIQSFARLLEKAENFSYYFFCDQDDVWLPNKVEKTLALLKKHESISPNKAIAAHTDLCVCREDLSPIQSSMKLPFERILKSDDQFSILLAQNFVTGCTLAINQRAKKLILPIPTGAMMHDWWIALVVASLGALVYLPEVTVQYRQHNRNASGSALANGIRGGLKKFVGEHEKMKLLMNQRFQQSHALESRLSQFAPNPSLFILQDFHSEFKKGPIAAIRGALKYKIKMNDLAHSLGYYYLLWQKAQTQKI